MSATSPPRLSLALPLFFNAVNGEFFAATRSEAPKGARVVA
jgi:hypothetical protein